MSHGSILVFGGNSRLAGALQRHLPVGTRYVARSASGTQCISIGDYASTPADLLSGVEVVINCAGIAAGAPALLRQANVDTPLHLARLARDAGVRRFVHVSSFSILGRADRIDADTPADPLSAYGVSKLAAEQALLPLATSGFAVACVRLPAIVGGGGSDKLGKLVGLWRRLRYLPVPRGAVRRSMISFDLAARVLADVAARGDRGIVHAADPIPFTYEDAATVVGTRAGRVAGVFRVPDAALALLRRWSPGIFDSLYTDSLLVPSLNRAAGFPSDLYETIATMARRGAAR